MIIAAAIREAETEYVVYFLLEAYLETAGRRDACKALPPRITMLPLTNKRDARARLALLTEEFDSASKRLDDAACAAIREALIVFDVALHRLDALDRNRSITQGGLVDATTGSQERERMPPLAYLPAPSAAKASTQA